VINLTESEFYKKRHSKEVFPVFIKINGDELTPVNIFYRLKGRYKFLLESAPTVGEVGRYSFLGSNPYMLLSSRGENITVTKNGVTKEKKCKVLDYAQEHLLKAYEKLDLELPFIGGAIGYIGYDVIRQYEKLPDNNMDELNLPEAYLLFYKEFICYDHFKHTLLLVHNVFPEDNEDYNTILNKLSAMKPIIREDSANHELIQASQNKEVRSNYTKA